MGWFAVINVIQIYLKNTHAKLIKPVQSTYTLITMKVFNYKTVKAESADCCSEKTKVRWLLTKEMGAENFDMRLFEMAPGGYSSLHKHLWEHEVFVLEGEGIVFDGHSTLPLQAGDVAYVQSNEQHQFKNNSEKTFKFLCIAPNIKV